MKQDLLLVTAIMCIALVSSMFLSEYGLNAEFSATTAPNLLAISGLVESPINLTYASLWSLPLLSEVATLQCIGNGQGGPSVTYNWTGVPLFRLLSMAKVVPGAYREVIFNATDGFSSSILLAEAMDPTTILGLMANGTDLGQVGGFGGGYRIILPGRWGYKWVSNVKAIIIVDYDYKGTYERNGLSDEATRPNSIMYPTVPAVEDFTAGENEQYTIQALTNSHIESYNYSLGRLISFGISGLEEASSYFYVKFPKALMSSPHQAYADHRPVKQDRTETDDNVYFVFTFPNSTSIIEIAHMSISAAASKTVVGQGYRLSANCTVRNEGDVSEAFNIAVYANSTPIASEVLTLNSGESSTFILTWNTVGFPYGKYDISALTNASQGGTGEQYDTYIDGTVLVTIAGDVNGDFKVDLYDTVSVCVVYGSKHGEPAYVSNCDINGDDKTNLYDAVIACGNYGQTIP